MRMEGGYNDGATWAEGFEGAIREIPWVNAPSVYFDSGR